MVTSVKQDKLFAEAMSETITSMLCGGDGILLETAIEWISYQLQPEEIFSREQLMAWAKENNLVDGGER